MNQGTIPFVNRHFSRLLVAVAVLLVSACASDEPEHVSTPEAKPERPQERIQVKEWYPTPKHQESPYYSFTQGAGQGMQHQQVITAPPTGQYGQGYGLAGQSWQPAPYPAQQGVQHYPAGGWDGYGQTQVQVPAMQPQPYQPAPQYPQAYSPVPQQYPAQPVPQYPQGYQPAPQYQPYQVQPQYQPAQRPWGVPGNGQESRAGGETRSLDTWQLPGGQYQGWNPPAYNGYSGQYGTVPGNAAPAYYW